jgi:outer membrane murein-binding lipoprotein Lpp
VYHSGIGSLFYTKGHVAMNPENQVLLDAIQQVVAGVQRLDTRMDQLDTRMDQLNARVDQLGTQVETLDIRTGQMSNVLIDLRERVPLLEERVDNGFRALKSDLNFAFSDTRKALAGQERNERAIEGLRREIGSLQQRVTALEQTRQAS